MEVKESKLEMNNSVIKEKGASPKDMPCASNFEDQCFHNNVEDLTEDGCGVVGGDASIKKEVKDEAEVDILGCNDNNETEVSECNDDGADAYSSSFSGTDSEHENDVTALNDQQADSMICDDTSLSLWVRKRKLTDHWRRFVRPIMWRCKWIDLKIRELQNQAQKYDKEVEKTYQAKQLELKNLKSEDTGIKALPPLSCYTQKTRIKKRTKRKLVEETSDVQSYASNHSLFSYYDCRKSLVNIPLNDNSRIQGKRNKSAKDERVFAEDIQPLEFKEGDAYLEQILLKIEIAKSEARNLKNRIDKVLRENPIRRSPVDTLKLVRSPDVITSSEQQKPQIVIKNEDEKSIISGEKPAKSASVSSHHNTPGEEEEETTDILLSELLASRLREGKAKVPDKKLQKTEQTSVQEGPSRPVRKRTPRIREIITKEETNPPKRHRVSRETPKSNVTMASKFKLPSRKRKRGKRRSGSAGVRRRS